jgi:hypothetical protein
MATHWYYAKNGTKQGPVSSRELKNLVDGGWLVPTDLVWKQGMPNWYPASKIKGLFQVQPPVVPPPMPVTAPVPPAAPIQQAIAPIQQAVQAELAAPDFQKVVRRVCLGFVILLAVPILTVVIAVAVDPRSSSGTTTSHTSAYHKGSAYAAERESVVEEGIRKGLTREQVEKMIDHLEGVYGR